MTSEHYQKKKALKNGLNVLKTRGPDFSDIKEVNQWIFGHSRLSIIDTSHGAHQPMNDTTGDYTIVFNGEIYNFQELKNNLLDQNYFFKTHSDTEVLLYHLIENGREGIKKLNGCFSFAFYKHKTDEILLARDPMGINPLFYSFNNNEFCFASTASALQSVIEHKRPLKNLGYYFRYGYIPGHETHFEDVYEVKPGEVITLNKAGDFHRWDLTFSVPQVKAGDKNETIKNLLENSVINRLQADVSVGCFLSGGIDSSIIAALAHRHKKDLKTFSIGIGDHSYYDESSYAESVAEHIGTNHQTIKITEADFHEHYSAFMKSLDAPFADASSVNLYFLSRATRKHVTVALSGDGADELFAGYRKHRAFLMAQQNNWKIKLVKALKPLVNNIKTNRDNRYSDTMRKIQKINQLVATSPEKRIEYLAAFGDEGWINKTIKKPCFYENFRCSEPDLNKMLLKDQKFVLPGDMLTKVDRMSMAHSLEVRTPFLDPNVVAWANNLNISDKCNGKKGKIILRNAFREILPDIVFSRPKKGFEIPLNQWLLSKIDCFEHADFFQKEYVQEQNLFDSEMITQLLKSFKEQSSATAGFHFWAYIVFQEWYKNNKNFIHA